MKIGDDVNDFGTPITVFKCEFCHNEFTVCPAIPDDNLHSWRGCLSIECESYTPNRDVDALLFFGCTEIEKRKIE